MTELISASGPTQEENRDNRRVSGGPDDPRAAEHEREWQRRTMPWMLGLLMFLSVVFILASIAGAATVRSDFLTERQHYVDSALLDLRGTVKASRIEDRVEAARFLTLASLDARLIELRHHRTSSLVLASIWTRFMGYLTGMILALIGAIFVLGRIRDSSATTISGGQQGFQGSMTTTWPGLILAVLGTILMLASSQIRTAGSQQEAPVYTQRWLAPAGSDGDSGSSAAPSSDIGTFPQDSLPNTDEGE
jgi:hypothetical protein